MADRPSTPDERFADGVTLAKNLWNNGVGRDAIADRLANRRYDKPAIDGILRLLPEGPPDNLMVRPPRAGAGRVTLIALGLMVWGIGAAMLAMSRAPGGPPVLILGVPFFVIGGVLIRAGRS